MRKLIAMSFAGVLLVGTFGGCYIKKEKIHEPTTSIERRTTVESVPEVRTRTTVEHDY
jgi:hypothetical protein